MSQVSPNEKESMTIESMTMTPEQIHDLHDDTKIEAVRQYPDTIGSDGRAYSSSGTTVLGTAKELKQIVRMPGDPHPDAWMRDERVNTLP